MLLYFNFKITALNYCIVYVSFLNFFKHYNFHNSYIFPGLRKCFENMTLHATTKFDVSTDFEVKNIWNITLLKLWVVVFRLYLELKHLLLKLKILIRDHSESFYLMLYNKEFTMFLFLISCINSWWDNVLHNRSEVP